VEVERDVRVESGVKCKADAYDSDAREEEAEKEELEADTAASMADDSTDADGAIRGVFL
jgi:hypothetical protein